MPVKMTKKNRLAILSRAHAIIKDPKRWTSGRLRRRVKGEYRYCLLGACEQAAYELNLVEPTSTAFRDGHDPNKLGYGYKLGRELSLYAYSRETRGFSPDVVNDSVGHEGALKLLDDYIKEVKKGKARKENP